MSALVHENWTRAQGSVVRGCSEQEPLSNQVHFGCNKNSALDAGTAHVEICAPVAKDDGLPKSSVHAEKDVKERKDGYIFSSRGLGTSLASELVGVERILAISTPRKVSGKGAHNILRWSKGLLYDGKGVYSHHELQDGIGCVRVWCRLKSVGERDKEREYGTRRKETERILGVEKSRWVPEEK